MTLDEIEPAVAGFDAALKPIATRPVDLSDPQWAAKMRAAPPPLDEAGIRSEVEHVLRAMLALYATGDEATRTAIRALFDRYTSFRWAAHVRRDPSPSADDFRWRLVHLSARDQGADPRDELLTLQADTDEASAAGIDVVPILREVAAMSSDVNRYGMGSVRDFLLCEAARDRH